MATTEQQPTAQRYGTLRAIAGLLTFVGGAAAIVGFVCLVLGLLLLMSSESRGLFLAVAGGAALPLGLLMLAGGEGINVQLDTEMNTRQAATAAAVMLADLREIRDAFGRIDASTRRTAQAVEALAAMVRK